MDVYPSLADTSETVSAAIQDSSSPGGAYDIAQFICRYFSKSQYADRTGDACPHGKWSPHGDAAFMELLGDFAVPFPVFAQDRLTYINRDMIQYVTPSNAAGLGGIIVYFDPSEDKAKRYPLPATGLLILGAFTGGKNQMTDGELQKFQVRLPAPMHGLTNSIIDFERSCYLDEEQSICTQHSLSSPQN